MSRYHQKLPTVGISQAETTLAPVAARGNTNTAMGNTLMFTSLWPNPSLHRTCAKSRAGR